MGLFRKAPRSVVVAEGQVAPEGALGIHRANTNLYLHHLLVLENQELTTDCSVVVDAPTYFQYVGWVGSRGTRNYLPGWEPTDAVRN